MLRGFWPRTCSLGLLLGVIAILSVACGGSNGILQKLAPTSVSSTTASTPAGASATPRPVRPTQRPQSTATEDPIAVAAAEYSAKADDSNACVDKVNAELDQIPSDAPWSDLVPIAQDWIPCHQDLQAALLEIAFPPTVATKASALAAALQTEITDLQAFIADPNATTWQTQQDADKAATSAAAALRLALHLPPPS